MAKDIRHQIILSKHELDLIQMCIRYEVERLFNTKEININKMTEIKTLVALSATIEDRWYRRGIK